MARNLVLLSAGLDSAVNFLIALDRGGVEAAVTVDYGQRAAAREMEKAKALCEKHQVEHIGIDASWLGQYSSDALTDARAELPAVSPDQLEDKALMRETMWAVWVPNRNGLLVNVGAAIAEARGIHWVVMGLNAEEASTFPDNSAGFILEVNHALAYSTLSQLRVRSFTIDWNKTAIFREALARGLNLGEVWSCYDGGELMCGKCESCAQLLRVAEAAGESVRLRGLFAEK